MSMGHVIWILLPTARNERLERNLVQMHSAPTPPACAHSRSTKSSGDSKVPRDPLWGTAETLKSTRVAKRQVQCQQTTMEILMVLERKK